MQSDGETLEVPNVKITKDEEYTQVRESVKQQKCFVFVTRNLPARNKL